MLKRLWRKLTPNPLDRMLRHAQQKNAKSVLIAWNRGLGDIALGLYTLVAQIRSFLPDARITFVTRPDLRDGFQLLRGVEVLVASDWKRGAPFDLSRTLKEHGVDRKSFDLVMEHPDPTYWLAWQLGKVTPQLVWNSAWDSLCERFALETGKHYIGVHVQTETHYAPGKNWPLSAWKEFFEKLAIKGDYRILLFGFQPTPLLEGEKIIDLRGKTTLLEMLSIIKNCCRTLVVPDSGVLSLTYYLDVQQPLKIISLWSDPRQGVLKQNVPSPNRFLQHIPLIGESEDTRTISVDRVLCALEEGA